MARLKKFDEKEAKIAAMVTFWRYGYDGASYDRLVRSTGASRKGLYSLWPDKVTLFRECLDLYFEALVKKSWSQIGSAHMTPESFDKIWNNLGVNNFNGEIIRGCLICRAKVECGDNMPFVHGYSERYYAGLRDSFGKALESVWRIEPPEAETALEPRAERAAAIASALMLLVGCDFEPAANGLRALGRASRK